jgi:hypothetical protein
MTLMRVAGIVRNGWPASSGIAGRNRPEYAFRGIERRRIFSDDQDRNNSIENLGDIVNR